MKKIISYFSVFEWILWIGSLIIITICFFAFKNTDYFYLIGSLIGATMIIFLAKANPIGQVLSIVFSLFYGVVSYGFRYYGEMITYLLMTMPIAIISLIVWLKNPFKGKKSEVEVYELKPKEYIVLTILSIVVTIVFYFILKVLNTKNLIFSTLSVFTSFLAVYLTMKRNRFFAIGYALNDLVLIVLWSLAVKENPVYISMVVCFVTFLINDTYSFINWTLIGKKQKKVDIE